MMLANGAQSSRVPVPLPDDPYVAVRQAQLVDTDTESDLEEASLKVEELQTDSSHSSASSDSITPLSPDQPLTHVLPTPIPTRVSFHRRTARMAVCTQPTLSPSMSGRIAEAAALSLSFFRDRYRSSYKTSSSSSLTLSGRKRYRESQGLGDEDHGLSGESQGLEDAGLGLEKEEAAHGVNRMQFWLLIQL
nr:hypothetical protein [Tanacetum cinerariifolium]